VRSTTSLGIHFEVFEVSISASNEWECWGAVSCSKDSKFKSSQLCRPVLRFKLPPLLGLFGAGDAVGRLASGLQKNSLVRIGCGGVAVCTVKRGCFVHSSVSKKAHLDDQVTRRLAERSAGVCTNFSR
jgi:hypothetical protein